MTKQTNQSTTNPPTETNLQREIKYIDLFAGVGGFHYGIDMGCLQQETGKESNNNNNTTHELVKWECVYSNEWDKYANSVYRRHYGECDIRDIRTVEAGELPEFDLLCGGFPCQAFSVAGKRGGFDDTRGTLFFEIARICKERQPKYLLLENVKGLLSHDQGRTFSTILGVLSDIGYDVQWQVLNSKDFGVPQNRERVYIVGNLRNLPRPKVFPLTNLNPKALEYVGGILSEKSKMWLDNGKQFSRNFPQGSRVYGDSGISSTLASQAGGLGAKTGLYATRQPLRFLNRNQKNIKGDYALTVDASQTSGVKIHPTIDANYYKGPSHQRRMLQQETKIRRLTPTECERLQGFPDGWTEYGADGEKISDSQRYKMMGNAVTTNVVTEVMRRLL